VSSPPIQFTDGAAYERYMGKWSQLVGQAFLEWLAPKPNSRWLDVGCGNGAFTELLYGHCHPASVDGLDPSLAQLNYARLRPALQGTRFTQGDAMALPFAAQSFDAAVMPLVIFFVPEPAQGVAEMARVVRPGGSVSAYGWDMRDGGFPYAALQAEIQAMGIAVLKPPNPDASGLQTMHALWTAAGLQSVQTRCIEVQRTFADFEDYWSTVLGGPSVGPKLAAMTPNEIAHLKTRMQALLPADGQGRITYSARANAINGYAPSPGL
jgi:ubiquinone/menaquinone biosynthesis C-methylase UbiE